MSSSDSEREENVAEEEWREDESGYDIARLYPIICNRKKTWEFLVEYGVYKQNQRCSQKNCRRNMSIVEDSKLADGAFWRCNTCKKF